MTSPPPAAWPGCHGVRIDSDGLQLGHARGSPIAEAVVRTGHVAPPAGEELWRLHAEVRTEHGLLTTDRRLYERRDGTLVLHGTSGPTLEVDRGQNRVTISEGAESTRLQLLTTFGLPLLLHAYPVLLVHAAACERAGRAVVLCGDTGSGKSSLLVALIDGGWRAVSEDVCALDLRREPPLVWPGPPWVRRAYGEGGPTGARLRFHTPDKAAWDIAPWQVEAAVPVSRLVFLDPPRADAPAWQTVSRAEAVAALARHAVWLADPARRARASFGPVVEVTAQVPGFRSRLPFGPSRPDELCRLLAAEV